MPNGNSTPISTFSAPTPTIDIEVFMEHLTGQLQRERRMFLAMVDERERMLGIKPRTAELRKWWHERQE